MTMSIALMMRLLSRIKGMKNEKCKVQKATIKEELMSIAWYPNRVMD